MRRCRASSPTTRISMNDKGRCDPGQCHERVGGRAGRGGDLLNEGVQSKVVVG